MKRLLSRQEAADELGISLSSLQRLIRARAIEVTRPTARLVKISPKALDDYLKRRAQPALVADYRQVAVKFPREKPRRKGLRVVEPVPVMSAREMLAVIAAGRKEDEGDAYRPNRAIRQNAKRTAPQS